MPDAGESRHEKSSFGLVAIGILKLVESSSLLALGIGLIHGRHQDLGEVASHWINSLWLGRHYFDRMISRLSSLD